MWEAEKQIGGIMAKLTKQGQHLLAWLRHWELSSKIADEETAGALTPEAKNDEKKALALFRRMVRAKYAKK
jgi:hypothetical protein